MIELVRRGTGYELLVDGKPLLNGHTGEPEVFLKKEVYSALHGAPGRLYRAAKFLQLNPR